MKNIILLATALFFSAMALNAQDTTNDFWTNDASGNITTYGTGFNGAVTIRRDDGAPNFILHGKSSNTWQSGILRFSATDNDSRWYLMHRGTKSPTQYKDLTFYSYDANRSTPWKMSMIMKHATGAVGINTNSVPSGYILAARGKAIFEEVKVSLYANWPDYVFAPEYNLTPLNELKTQIEELGHLPNVPSAEEVAENGFHLGEMDATLLEKIEELTLYLIEVNETVEVLNDKVSSLTEENEVLSSKLTKLSK